MAVPFSGGVQTPETLMRMSRRLELYTMPLEPSDTKSSRLRARPEPL